MIKVTQSIEQLSDKLEELEIRDYDHRSRSNNWLKYHHKPMRRKPFKRNVFYLIDEFYKIGKLF